MSLARCDAYLRLNGYLFGYDREAEQQAALHEAEVAAERALAIDPDNSNALLALSAARHYAGTYAQSAANARRVLALDPHDPGAMGTLGWRLTLRGAYDQGVALLERAIERSAPPEPCGQSGNGRDARP